MVRLETGGWWRMDLWWFLGKTCWSFLDPNLALLLYPVSDSRVRSIKPCCNPGQNQTLQSSRKPQERANSYQCLMFFDIFCRGLMQFLLRLWPTMVWTINTHLPLGFFGADGLDVRRGWTSRIILWVLSHFVTGGGGQWSNLPCPWIGMMFLSTCVHGFFMLIYRYGDDLGVSLHICFSLWRIVKVSKIAWWCQPSKRLDLFD